MKEEQLIPQGAPAQQALRITAAHWLQRIHDDAISDAEIAEWLQWYREHEAHRHAFDRAELMFRKLRAAPPEYKQMMRQAGAVKATNTQPSWIRARSHRWRWAAAAAVVLFSAALLTVWQSSLQGAAAGVQRYETARGEHRKVILPDGSIAVVGARSVLETAFDTRQRHLKVVSGEAFFDVKREASRPFVVRAGPTQVTALGTAFDVRLGTDRVAVSVVNGAVEVKRHAQLFVPTPKGVRVAAGERVVVLASPSLNRKAPVEVTSIDPATAATWQRGYVSFTGEPLSSVIDSVNRYADRQVKIADASVGQMTYAGTVFWDRADEWIENLPQIFPLRAVRQKDGTVVLLAQMEKK